MQAHALTLKNDGDDDDKSYTNQRRRMINRFSRMLLILLYQGWNFRHLPSSAECVIKTRNDKTKCAFECGMENGKEKTNSLSVFDFTQRSMNLFTISTRNRTKIFRYSGLHISFAIDMFVCVYAIWCAAIPYSKHIPAHCTHIKIMQ